MARFLFALLLVAAFAGIIGSATALAADPGAIDGDLPRDGGVALVTWGGGDLDAVEAAAEDGGCALLSVWQYVGGRAIGYLAGAPDFVNRDFLDAHSGGEIAAGPLLIVCRSAASGGREIEPVAFAPMFDGHVFDAPIELVAYPGGRFLVAQQGGEVLLLDGGGDGTGRAFLNLPVRREGSEEGLLSLALDPEFASDRHVWAYYSVSGGERRTRLSRFTVANDAVNRASELVILEIPQPFENHNGGAIRFGPDGMLYLGTGDGGSGGDPQGNGQDLTDLLGSILRIDVRNASAPAPYVIPSNNPYASGGGRGEIWAYGFRNPWRMAFDEATGRLWVGDVGQSALEEIDIVTRGGNFGWNRMEGDQCFRSGCSSSGTVLPVATYGRDGGCSVTGGVVARDPDVPEVAGAYLFADYCSGRVWATDADDPGDLVEVGRVSGNPTSFALGHDGEVYIVQFGSPIMRVVSP